MFTTRAFLAAVLAGLCLAATGPADEKKDKAKEGKKGTVVGTLTAKGDNFIEVKADGEEKGRRYVPHWRGGAPAAGGGLDKKMLAVFKTLKIGSRVRVEWAYEERYRAEKVEVLKAPAEKDKN
jgi:hypothetical protein